MPKLSQRLRVWRGEIRKTTGGLTKADLMKNGKGKIVSKRKSLSAFKVNNLGSWLRQTGDKFSGKLKGDTKKEAVDLTSDKKAPLKSRVKMPKKPKAAKNNNGMVAKKIKARLT